MLDLRLAKALEIALMQLKCGLETTSSSCPPSSMSAIANIHVSRVPGVMSCVAGNMTRVGLILATWQARCR